MIDSGSVIQAVLGDDPELIESCVLLWRRGEKKLKALYGDECDEVIRQCYEVSPFFCFQVVTNVYGIWWSDAHLTDYQRSIITCAALLAGGQLNQFRVLVKTFLVSGGNNNKLKALVDYMCDQQYCISKLSHDILSLLSDSPETLTSEEKFLIDLACAVAQKGDMKALLHSFPATLNQDDVLIAINHLLTYIGCPLVWDGTVNIRSAFQTLEN